MDLTAGDLKRIKGVKVLNESRLTREGFKKVTIDSRKCSKGDLFFAVKGERFDGHDFVELAFKKGISCAVVSKGWYKSLSENKKCSFKNFSFALVNNTLEALGELANIYRKKFIIPVIAIGGSNGKTSTKDYMAHVLAEKYNVLKTEGNYNNAYGVPLTLFRLNKRHEIAVIEVGTNHFGEVKYLCSIAEPQIGLITNIGKEHLEFLRDIKGAARAECELLEYLDENFGMFFLNSDDEQLVKHEHKYLVNTFSYGTKAKVDVKAKLLKFEGFNAITEINFVKTKIRTKLKEIGNQSFNSALAAAAVGFYFEVSAKKIRKAISEYKIESGKRNQLKEKNDVSIIDDSYNSNPDSVKAALENMKAYKIKGKKYLVLADMLELGKTSRKEHTNIGKLVKAMYFENLYTYGKDSYYMHIAAKGVKNNFHFEDKHVLAKMLKLNIRKGDLILIKGSRAMKMEDVIAEL
ncbi:MAG TPA: UDP-N-acetylmuramoyl-tripeptide--D-alanyl-D-alanine ligase [Ignavibacteria bacterium]|jgi:UDP-N-acetylmuramoyl-tripeptide--D-alanyl-D-alanine ligase